MTVKSFIFYIIIIALTTLSVNCSKNDENELAVLFNQIVIVLIAFVIVLKILL